MPDQRIDQIELVCSIMQHLSTQGITHALPREVNAVIAAANSIVDEFAKPEVKVTPGMGLRAWLQSDHTGLSSLYMARVLANATYPMSRDAEPAEPRDADDFKRCMGLLEACPEIRELIPKMAGHGRIWDRLIDKWAEIESLINSGKWNEANELIKAVEEGAR